MTFSKILFTFFICLVSFIFFSLPAIGQVQPEILVNEQLKRIVPTSFYFAGQSADTQFRNSAAAKIGKDRYVIAGLVDTSGYSTEISGKYEGFFITDSNIKLGNKILQTGAYGFGFTKNALNIFDLSSKLVLSVKTIEDENLKRPRPLMMVTDSQGVRLYKGKIFVKIAKK